MCEGAHPIGEIASVIQYEFERIVLVKKSIYEIRVGCGRNISCSFSNFKQFVLWKGVSQYDRFTKTTTIYWKG